MITSRAILQELTDSVSDKVLTLYEQLASQKEPKGSQAAISQNRALQLLFDLKFTTSILPKKVDEQVCKCLAPTQMSANT